MKSKLFTTMFALAASICVSQSASAFVAVTGIDPATNESGGSLTVGTEYSVQGGDFVSYDPGTNGPALTGNPADYRYDVDGTITAIDSAADTATLDGTYQVFYDANGNGTYDPGMGDTSVSFGDVALTISLGSSGTGTLSGSFTQLDGPSSGSAGFSGSAAATGAYTITDANNDATFDLTLTSVPEPGTWAAMLSGAGLLGAVRFRKRL